MKSKFLVAVALLLVVALSLCPFALAETTTVSVDDITYILDTAVVNRLAGTSGTYTFTGQPLFNLSFSTFNSNCSELQVFKINSSYDALINMTFTNAFGVEFSLPNVSYVYRFPSSNVTSNTVNFVVPTGFTYDYYLLVANYTTSGVNGGSDFRLNDVLLSDTDYNTSHYHIYLQKASGRAVFSQSNTNASYPVFDFSGTLNASYLSSLYLDLWTFSLPTGSYTLRGVSSPSAPCYVVSQWCSYSFDSEYSIGYDAGYSDGYANGYIAGGDISFGDGYSAGISYADSIVNESSASYLAGKSAGIQSANNYSFLTLIGAVIDAPIRAFFGYTEDGVTHPGLFSLNILGYDMSALVLSLLSMCVLVLIIRLCLGGK